MKFSVSHRSALKKRHRGFALVATLVMLSLLMVLSVGMLSLSVVTVRTTDRDRAAQQARANARLALQIALGELQRLAGPDGRVTASSSIVAGETGQRHLTGVWDGWKWDGDGRAPDWGSEKDQRFKGWLVSSNILEDARRRDFVDQPSNENSVTLVADSEEPGSEVRADIVRLDRKGRRYDDGYAWAVFDESQKASVSVSPEREDDTYGRALEKFSAAHEPGYGVVGNYRWEGLSSRKNERPFLVTREQAGFVGLEKRDLPFHDVTSGTFGLLTDVAKGGLASDLSRLFEGDTLPASHRSRFIYSNQDQPLVSPPERFAGANPLPSPDPSWELLHSHYRTYTRLTGGERPRINANVADVEARPFPGAGGGDLALRHPGFHQQQIAPVIAKAQFVFSLTFGVNMNTLQNMWASGGARSTPASLRDSYITWLVIDPVITLWNPYNVPLEFSGATVELYRIPMAFRLYKNGTRIAENFTRLTDAHTQGDFQSRQNRFYLLKLLPEKGQGTLLMQPGEHVVFTGHHWTLHGSHTYNKEGLEMRPGFNPPAGADSSDEIGGVTTQNLFVSPSGSTTGKDYGKNVRTIAVKGGDQIQVEVRPERAGADEMPEANGKEVTGFLKYYLGVEGAPGAERKLIGGIEIDYGEKEKELLPEYSRHDLPTIVVNSAIPKGVPNDNSLSPEERGADAALRWKEPFLIATFQQKTERDSRFPSRSWINNGPTNLYSSAGIDEDEDFAHQQYEFKWEPMTDWPPDSPTIEISNERNRGYGGSGIYAQTGTELATFSSLPVAPAHSLGQLSHAPLNGSGQLPLTTRVVGNSFAPPLLPEGKVKEPSQNRTFLDHSYLANNALFDSWFLSTVADHPALGGIRARDSKAILEGFFKGKERLPNSRFVPYLGGKKADEVLDAIEDEKEGYRKASRHLLVEAPFNVNSTSVSAWEALLASNFGADAPLVTGELDGGDGLPVLRNVPAVSSSYESSGSEYTKWNGYRRLNEKQIRELAAAIVDEVKERGPFQSLAEFINRRPGGRGELSKYGAVQSAIQKTGLNDEVIDSAHNFEGSSGANPTAASGNTADGAPGVISQADLLTPLLPQLTARGDTFVVRAYGEAVNDDGSKARAWCEATVQRYPEYLDPSDEPEAEPSTFVNQTFGRRFQVVSFRWLKSQDL